MSFCDLLAAKLLLFQIIETLFIIKFKEKIMKTQAVEPTSWSQAVEPTSWSQYIENAPAIVITSHIFIYIGLCYATEHVMTKKYIIDFLAFSLLKKQKTSPSGLNLV